MAEIDKKFMQGNKATLKAMSQTYGKKKAAGAVKRSKKK